MTVGEFERVLRSFADDASDLDVSNGKVVVEIWDELVHASLEDSLGEVYVVENGGRVSAAKWLVQRIARVPLLADRILKHVEDEPYYVAPSGRLLDRVNDAPEDADQEIPDVGVDVLKRLRGTTGTTSVHYLTSDAGEGKTTLINWMARRQAERYKRKDANWLLVPIRLGGRAFLSFDDIVVAELSNKLRFPFFYYDAFIELVRMRIIVPAFDGFEEMFVERSSGEAISALSNLIRDLQSSGSILVAARKAYFEYGSLETQAKLFDAIQDQSVSVDYARTSLGRWNRQKFLEYARKRGVSDGPQMYERVENRTGVKHPVLTRAVLVKRLIDVSQQGEAGELLDRLEQEPYDYFHSFVESIVAREAREKWIDRSGSPRQPLMTVDEHHGLLAEVAKEMWITSTDVLRRDYLELVAELFAADRDKDPSIVRQIKERVTQHSVLALRGLRYGFDHEDFQSYYLGEGLGRIFTASTGLSDVRIDLDDYLRKRILPSLAADSAVNAAKRNGVDPRVFLEALQWLVKRAHPSSYIVENAGALAVRLLESINDDKRTDLTGFVFPQDSLRGRQLGRVRFQQCQFLSTSLDGARLAGSRFEECTMQELSWSKRFEAAGAAIRGGTVTSVIRGGGRGIYAPLDVRQALRGAGFRVEDPPGKPEEVWVEPDTDTRLAERAFRAFIRTTHVHEDVFRRKCGTQARQFFGKVLPKMLEAGVLADDEAVRNQRRYKLAVPMRAVATQVPARVETLDEFLAAIRAAA